MKEILAILYLKMGGENKRLFKTIDEAKEFIYSINYNPLIIIIDFHQKR